MVVIAIIVIAAALIMGKIFGIFGGRDKDEPNSVLSGRE